jgi:hypothetical protein
VVRHATSLLCIAALSTAALAAEHAGWFMNPAPRPAAAEAPFLARAVGLDEAEVGTVLLAELAQLRAAGGRDPGFRFTRAVYSGWRNRWATDYPKSDQQFAAVLARLTNVDASPLANPVRLDDPELRRYPFLYLVEPGYMTMTAAEVAGLRAYLDAGGFLVVDDFWGTREWANFEGEMRQVYPDRVIEELPLSHPLFSIFYRIDDIVQVPAINRAAGPTHEQDGYVPHVRGIFDDDGRLAVVINWNTDLGDAWEWAEQPHYPLRYSTYAFRMGVNLVVYALSH